MKIFGFIFFGLWFAYIFLCFLSQFNNKILEFMYDYMEGSQTSREHAQSFIFIQNSDNKS